MSIHTVSTLAAACNQESGACMARLTMTLQTGYRSAGLPLSGSAEQCCVTECTTAVEDHCCGAGLREANGELMLGLGKAMGTCMH
jgi:hypothetical protein